MNETGDLTLYGVGIWGAALVFARTGAMLMLLPGVGEPAVPGRVRLGLALMIAAAVAPALADRMPPMPDNAWAAAGFVMGEVVIGLMFGAAARLLMTATATAGQLMGLELGLAFAQTADPTMTQSGQILAVFLGVMGMALVFATGLDHMFIQGLAGTYDILAPGVAPPIGDGADMALTAVSTSFRVGFQIAAPVIVAGMVFRLGLGVLSRLIPQIQVFFVVLPLQILGGFVIIALGLSGGMLVWLDSVQQYAEWVR